MSPPNAGGNASWNFIKAGLVGLLLTAATMVVVLLGSNAAFHNPASPEAEFIFTFRVYGDWVSGVSVAALDDATVTRPIHMRTAQPTHRTRYPVTVGIEVDGHKEQHIYRPKGFKSDGTSVGELRVPLTPGTHRITVTVATSADPSVSAQTWTEVVTARTGRLSVLTLESGHGFEFAP